MFFRCIRVPQLFEARRLVETDKLVLIDSYYDKLSSLYIKDKKNFSWIFDYGNEEEKNTNSEYYKCLEKITEIDYQTLPDADYIIFLETTENVWRQFLLRRNRQLDRNSQFLRSFDGQESMKNAVFQYQIDQEAKGKRVEIINHFQRFDSANTIAWEIYRKIKKNENRKFDRILQYLTNV